MLDTLDVTSFDHVLALSVTVGRTQEMADARTMVTLLHLRDLERIADKRVPITSEILDIGNRDLASVAEADDFIVSNTLVSLMVSQSPRTRTWWACSRSCSRRRATRSISSPRVTTCRTAAPHPR